MKKLLAFVAVLAAVSFHVWAQDNPSPRIVVTDTQSRPADPSIGKWKGDWQSRGQAVGPMEMEVDVQGEQVTGRVRSSGSPGCSLEWVKLSGVRKGEQFVGQYNLSGRCGKVDITYTIDREGKVMAGTWSSEYPGSGTFRLTK